MATAQIEEVKSPARIRCERLLARSPDEKWSTRKLAEEALCHKDTAMHALREWRGQIRAESSLVAKSHGSRLAEVARLTRSSEVEACERMLSLIDDLTEQIENGQDLDAKELDSLISIRAKYYKHIEAVTGLDVVKAAAMRTLSDPGGQAMSWDGIEALEAVSFVVQEEPRALPPPRKTAKDLF